MSVREQLGRGHVPLHLARPRAAHSSRPPSSRRASSSRSRIRTSSRAEAGGEHRVAPSPGRRGPSRGARSGAWARVARPSPARRERPRHRPPRPDRRPCRRIGGSSDTGPRRAGAPSESPTARGLLGPARLDADTSRARLPRARGPAPRTTCRRPSAGARRLPGPGRPDRLRRTHGRVAPRSSAKS